MAFEDLLRALTARADAEIAALLTGAREQAASIQRASDQHCADRSATVLRDRTRAISMETERAAAEAARLERHAELAARISARERVLVAARARLALADQRPDYQASIAARFADAVAVIGDASARLRCAPALAPVLTRLAAASPNIQVQPDGQVTGGFSIESADGRVLVDEILEHRLAGDAEALGQLALRSLETGP